MPIKWSAVRISQAMDEVEAQLNLAQSFMDEAQAMVQEARRTPDLAGYIDQRLARLEFDIKDRFGRLKAAIESVRKAIPEGAIEAERGSGRHGTTQSLI